MRPKNRIDNPKTIDKDLVEKELQLGKEVVIQFVSNTYTDKILTEINELCSNNNESLCIRFYGHYSSSFNCSTLQKIPNVKCLYIDCLLKAENTHFITELRNLKRLCIGIYELENTEILNSNNLRNLSELIVTETKTKAFNLDYIRKIESLKVLRIGGHTKNIEAIGELNELELLSLNSVKKVPVDFINKLSTLKTLNFILGSRENLNEIKENNIENLEIVWVRGFNDLTCISSFPNLKTLRIEDEIKLSKISFNKDFPSLTDLKIINCKNLETISGLKNLSNLNTLIVSRTNINFNNFMMEEFPKELKYLGFHTTSSKLDKEYKTIINKRGYECR